MRDRLSQIQRGLIPGERYTARVRAVSRLGVKSDWSDSVDFVTANDASTPNPPTNLILTFQRETLIIEWTSPTLNTDGTFLGDLSHFVITINNGTSSAEYQTDNDFFLYTLEQNENDFLTAGTSLTVSVKAVDTTGAESTEISDTVSNAAPLKPQTPTIDVSETTMTVSMSPNAADKDIVAYRIERSLTSGSGFTQIGETNSDAYFNTGSPSTTYYFRYRTIDFFGQVSPYSDEGVATTGTLRARQHNSLSGLGDDDHTQYHNNTRHDAHDHSTAMSTVVLEDISDVTETGIATGDLLRWNGTAWVNYPDTPYSLTDGSRAFTGEVAGVTPTVDASLATKGYVDSEIAGSNAVNTVGATGATETLSFNTEVHDMTMDQNCTFSFADAPASGNHGSMTVIVRGAFTPTWPASVLWDSGTEPTYSAPAVYSFLTVDGGTNVFGFAAGLAMS